MPSLVLLFKRVFFLKFLHENNVYDILTDDDLADYVYIRLHTDLLCIGRMNYSKMWVVGFLHVL
jgi:hypothetical protein